jgi:hypothetical protein
MRILLDEQRMLEALDAHPNIRVRLLNSFCTRNPSVESKILQLSLEGCWLNRRTHQQFETISEEPGRAETVPLRSPGSAIDCRITATPPA